MQQGELYGSTQRNHKVIHQSGADASTSLGNIHENHRQPLRTQNVGPDNVVGKGFDDRDEGGYDFSRLGPLLRRYRKFNYRC